MMIFAKCLHRPRRLTFGIYTSPADAQHGVFWNSVLSCLNLHTRFWSQQKNTNMVNNDVCAQQGGFKKSRFSEKRFENVSDWLKLYSIPSEIWTAEPFVEKSLLKNMIFGCFESGLLRFEKIVRSDFLCFRRFLRTDFLFLATFGTSFLRDLPAVITYRQKGHSQNQKVRSHKKNRFSRRELSLLGPTRST